MSSHAKTCPVCGCGQLSDNGGADGHATAHSAHFLLEGLAHANPLKLAMGAGGLAMRAFNPKRFTCLECGHVFKA